jgi:hypothetical protein
VLQIWTPLFTIAIFSLTSVVLVSQFVVPSTPAVFTFTNYVYVPIFGKNSTQVKFLNIEKVQTNEQLQKGFYPTLKGANVSVAYTIGTALYIVVASIYTLSYGAMFVAMCVQKSESTVVATTTNAAVKRECC